MNPESTPRPSTAGPDEVEREHVTALENFVRMTSHEFRTPLQSIIGFTETLRDHWDETSDEDKLRFIDAIHRQGTRMARLAEDLLSLTRLDSAPEEAESEAVDVLGEVAEALVDLGEPAAEFEVLNRLDGPVTVEAPPGRVAEVVGNLLTNAQKYGAPPFEIAVDRAEDHVEIAVSDAGPGIDDAFVDDLFEPFTRERKNDQPGTGLGLAIVRQVADLLGGDVRYEPRNPTGARFVISLPVADAALSDGAQHGE